MRYGNHRSLQIGSFWYTIFITQTWNAFTIKTHKIHSQFCHKQTCKIYKSNRLFLFRIWQLFGHINIHLHGLNAILYFYLIDVFLHNIRFLLFGYKNWFQYWRYGRGFLLFIAIFIIALFSWGSISMVSSFSGRLLWWAVGTRKLKKLFFQICSAFFLCYWSYLLIQLASINCLRKQTCPRSRWKHWSCWFFGGRRCIASVGLMGFIWWICG